MTERWLGLWRVGHTVSSTSRVIEVSDNIFIQKIAHLLGFVLGIIAKSYLNVPYASTMVFLLEHCPQGQKLVGPL
jgi:hypothetical protein